MASPGDQGAVASLSRLVGTGGIGISVSLFRNNFTPTPQSLPGDFVNCDFAGYEAMSSKKWTGPADDGDGVAVMTSPPFTWVKTSDGSPQPIYGFRLSVGGTELAPATNVLFARRLSAPVQLSKRGATLEARFVITAVQDGLLTGTPLIIACDIQLRVDQVRLRGTRLALVRGMMRRLTQVLAADEREANAAESHARYANLFVNDDATAGSIGSIVDRANEVLAR